MSLKQSLSLLEPLDGLLWRDIMGFMMRRGKHDRDLCDLEVQDHIQGACQRAIKAREWWVDMLHSGKNPSVIIGIGLGKGKSASGETEAEAYLTAYVAALQELA
jgi:hypothetical protein